MKNRRILDKLITLKERKKMTVLQKLQEAKDLAGDVLEFYSIKSPPVPIEDIIEGYGLKLDFIDLKEEGNGIAGLLDARTNTILVNIHDNPRRQRFTIAHELCHALLHKEMLKDNPDLGIFYRKSIDTYELTDSSDQVEEKQANHFAAHLLIPEKFLRKFAPLCNYSPILLAEIFNVSVQALKFHMNNLGINASHDL
jgi:Zn-dependent peptidase ImmA (M78 family)